MSSESLEVKIVEDKGSVNKLVASVDKLADTAEKAGKATDKSAEATKKQGDAADKAATDNTKLDKALGGIASTGNLLKTALGGAIAALSIEKIVGYADAYTGISNKLRLVTTDQGKLNSILDASYKIAQETGTGFKQVADVYGKVDAAVKGYNGNAKDVPTITKAIAQAVALTGPSSEEAANGLRQFGQTMDIGKLSAEELNSIIESTPGLAKALEGGLRKSGVNVEGSLKEMAAAGKISTKQLLEGLKEIAPELDTLAKGAIPTVSAAFVRLENATIKYVGEANGAISGTRILAGAIDLVANNLNIAIPIFAAFVALLGLGAIAGAINSITALTGGVGAFKTAATTATVATRALSVAIFTNPLFLAATALTLGFLAVGLIKTGGSFSELGTRIKDTGAAILAFLAPIGQAIMKAGEWGLKVLQAAAQGLGLSNAIKAVTAAAVALVPSLGGASAAQTTSTVNALSYLDAQTKVGVALAKVRAEAATLPPAVAGVAPALSTVGTAGTVMATSLTTGANGILTVRNGFGSIPAAATTAAAGFSQVSGAATGALPGFAGVTQAAGAASGKFLEVSMNANRVAPGFVSAAAAAGPAATSLTNVGTAGQAAAAGVARTGEVTVTTGLQIASLTASTDPCTVSVTNLAKATADYVPPLERAAKAAEDARKAITEKDAAVAAASKGAEDYAKRLEKLSLNYNQLGEKLESASAATERYRRNQEAANQATQAALKNLEQYYTTTTTTTSATNSLSGSMGSLSSSTSSAGSAASSASGEFSALGQSFSSAQGALDKLNQSLGNYGALSASAKAGYGGTPGTPNRLGDFSSNLGLGNNESAGGFIVDTGKTEYVMYKGSPVGWFDGPGSSGARIRAQQWVDEQGPYSTPMELYLRLAKRDYGPDYKGPTAGLGVGINPPGKPRVTFGGPGGGMQPWNGDLGFAMGGSFMVGGNGGTDSQPVRFWATPNERVTVETPSQRMNNDRRNEEGGDSGKVQANRRIVNNTFVIKSSDADSFKRSKRQVGQDIVRKIQRSIG